MYRLFLCFFLAGTWTGALTAQNIALIPADLDNTLYESLSGAVSNGVGPHMFVGRTNSGSQRRALVRFNVAAALPSNVFINSVSLRLTMDMTISGSVLVNAHRVTADWGEGASFAGNANSGGGAPAQAGDATWIHRFSPGQLWTTPGGDFSTTISTSATVAGTGTYIFPTGPNMVADVTGWLANPSTNFGWLLRQTSTTSGTAKRFLTREATLLTQRPMLVVNYTPVVPAVVPSGYGCVLAGNAGPFALSIGGVPGIGSTFSIDFLRGPNNGLAEIYLAAGIATGPIPLGTGNCGIWLDLPSAIASITSGASPFGPFPLSPTGSGSFSVSLPMDPSLVGVSLTGQAAAVDPASGTLISSNAITVFIG